MAEELDSYEPERNDGPREKYPWDQWLNGKWWKLKKGEDFHCQADSMTDLIRKSAAKRNLKVQVYQEAHPGNKKRKQEPTCYLVIQAYEEEG